MPEFTGVQVALVLFFILMPICAWRFWKMGAEAGATYMVAMLHGSSFLNHKGIEALGLKDVKIEMEEDSDED